MNENEINKVEVVKASGSFQWVKSKLTRKTIIDIIIIVIPLMIIYIYFAGMKTSPELKQVLKDNKKIELKIDSLKKDNEFLVGRMFEMEKNQTVFYQMISETNDLMKINNKEISRLKRIYNDKISNVNGYNISQLDSFFADKYKNHYR